MANLYVSVNERSRSKLETSARVLARRYPELGTAIRGSDVVQFLMDLLFPNGMPMNYHVANLSVVDSPDENLILALRPVIHSGQEWHLPEGYAIAVKGYWPRKVRSPIFMVEDFVDVADVSTRPFERMLAVISYQEPPINPRDNNQRQHSQRDNNALTNELAHDLPPISITTRERFGDWNAFLEWKRQLVSEKTKGLRYVSRDWREEILVFQVVDENAEQLKTNFRVLSRVDVVAFNISTSTNEWVFKVESGNANARAPRGIELGQSNKPRDEDIKSDSDSIKDCPWKAPVTTELVIALSEDDQNSLSNAENEGDLEGRKERILSEIPTEGFLSVSSAGDLSLINRHAQALKLMSEQGGFAPYLASYMFDVRLANLPIAIEPITNWFRPELNRFQKEAVEKILAAPDLCLIQGPPGTGKTTVIAEAIMQLVHQGQTVLLVSQAHTAVDNALDRLGMSGDLRPIRLARNEDRISEDGKAFVNAAALKRYYTSLAKHAETTFLEPWRETSNAYQKLNRWLEQAKFLQHDLDKSRKEYEQLGSDAIRLQQERDRAWQKLNAAHQAYEHATEQRGYLKKLADFLRGAEPEFGQHVHLPESQATVLAHAIVRLSSIKIKTIFTPEDWKAGPTNRPLMLAGLLQEWRKLQAAEQRMADDASRLMAAGAGPLQDPAIIIRMVALQDEISAIAARMEDDDTLFPTWKAKQAELRKLKSAVGGGLDREVYGKFFVDADVWSQPVSNAQAMGEALELRLVGIRELAPVIDAALAGLQSAVNDLIISYEHEPVDSSDFDASEKILAQHLQKLKKAQAHAASLQANAASVLKDESNTAGGRLPKPPDNMTLAQRIQESAEITTDLEKLISKHKSDQATWGGVFNDWVADLCKADAAVSDWPHFREHFVPMCNVVAITCNEREQTLRDVGHISFDVAIIDEVSKATPLEMLLPLMRARRAVLVGDHRQLPPLFQEGADASTFSDKVSETEDEAALDGCENRSLLTKENLRRFEKMVSASLFKSHFESADDSIRSRLVVQFRMHPQIMATVNHFYEGQLLCGLENPDQDRAHGLTIMDKRDVPLLTPDDHVLWIDTTRDLKGNMHREDMDGPRTPARTNRLEAELIAYTLEQLDKESRLAGYSSQRRRKVGVVSFYARQCRLIREAIRRYHPNGKFDCLDLDINTVIKYQGKEKAIILVSLVRNNGASVDKQGHPIRRSSKANVARFEFINVAFSRAQELLMVFGARGMYESYEVTLPNMNSEGTSTRLVYKDILDELDRNARLKPASLVMEDIPEASSSRPRSDNLKKNQSQVRKEYVR